MPSRTPAKLTTGRPRDGPPVGNSRANHLPRVVHARALVSTSWKWHPASGEVPPRNKRPLIHLNSPGGRADGIRERGHPKMVPERQAGTPQLSEGLDSLRRSPRSKGRRPSVVLMPFLA